MNWIQKTHLREIIKIQALWKGYQTRKIITFIKMNQAVSLICVINYIFRVEKNISQLRSLKKQSARAVIMVLNF
jgi:hypothetical protein